MSAADLPLVPCSECGDTDPAHHVYGLVKCCPDCRHVLADHDRQVAARALRDAADEVDLDPAITGGYSGHHNAEAAAETWLRARANSLAPRPAAPGVSVSAEQVEAAARSTIAPGVNPWSLRFRRDLYDFLAALGITVTDGGEE